jgi:NTP pyrophosphatase (non-canonical NTP hydrolase)
MMKMVMKAKKMNGHKGEPSSLLSLFDAQKCYQYLVTNQQTPVDSIKWFTYHALAMQEEMGELLASDKRWKTHRNEKFAKANKIEELADIFITAINLALYSGFDAETLAESVAYKIEQNRKKFVAGLEKK